MSLFPADKVRLDTENLAIFMRENLIALSIVHGVSFFILLFREVKETQLGSQGQIQRFIEVLGMGFYTITIVKSLQIWSIMVYFRQITNFFPDHVQCVRPGLVDKDIIVQWAGTSSQIIQIEVGVFFTFSLTIVILLIRARCGPVGTDNSQQFEPTYMSYLARAIIEGIKAKYGKKLTGPKMQRLYGRYISVDVEGIVIKVLIDEKLTMNILSKMELGAKFDGVYIEEEDAVEWIKTYLEGNIDKVQLDDQRHQETIGLDMLQNTNFVYHPESLIEMQIVCLVLIYMSNNGLLAQGNDYPAPGEIWQDISKDKSSSNFIMFTLFIEHVLSYLIAYFRFYDIEKNGRMDINGVKRATNESKLSSLQFFIGCIIIGFTLNHMLQVEDFYTKEI